MNSLLSEENRFSDSRRHGQ